MTYNHKIIILSLILILFYGCESINNHTSSIIESTNSDSTQFDFFKNDSSQVTNNSDVLDKNELLTESKIIANSFEDERSIPKYGFNGSNIRGVKWSTPSLMKRIKLLKMNLIRYPGGNNANWWDWKTGWFVKNDKLPKKYGKITNEIISDIPELKLFVEKTNSEVLFVLNILTATLSNQLSMLREAKKNGIEIKWVELGNELNIAVNPGNKTYKNGAIYGTVAKEWIKAIETEFPLARIAVIGGNRRANPELRKWNDHTLSQAPNSDAIVWHAYPSAKNFIGNSEEYNYEQLYKNTIALYNGLGFNKLKTEQDIWVTEYNVQWTKINDSANKKKTQNIATSWGHALGTLLLTSTITDISPRIKVVLNHNLTGFPIFAAIETFPNNGYPLLANGIAMKEWLDFTDKMKNIRKIKFEKNGSSINDFSLFGWAVNNEKNEKILIVNMENKRTEIDLTKIQLGEKKYHSIYADRTSQVQNLNGIKEFNDVSVNKKIYLPANSITIIQ